MYIGEVFSEKRKVLGELQQNIHGDIDSDVGETTTLDKLGPYQMDCPW